MHLFIYNIFLIIYSIGIRITSLWNPKARLWLRGRRNVWAELEGIGRLKTEAKRPKGEGKSPDLENDSLKAEGPHSPLTPSERQPERIILAGIIRAGIQGNIGQQGIVHKKGLLLYISYLLPVLFAL